MTGQFEPCRRRSAEPAHRRWCQSLTEPLLSRFYPCNSKHDSLVFAGTGCLEIQLGIVLTNLWFFILIMNLATFGYVKGLSFQRKLSLDFENLNWPANKSKPLRLSD